jgi:hypothetical protein
MATILYNTNTLKTFIIQPGFGNLFKVEFEGHIHNNNNNNNNNNTISIY